LKDGKPKLTDEKKKICKISNNTEELLGQELGIEVVTISFVLLWHCREVEEMMWNTFMHACIILQILTTT
jgi:hypothetical protein